VTPTFGLVNIFNHKIYTTVGPFSFIGVGGAEPMFWMLIFTGAVPGLKYPFFSSTGDPIVDKVLSLRVSEGTIWAMRAVSSRSAVPLTFSYPKAFKKTYRPVATRDPAKGPTPTGQTSQRRGIQ
jgi:hypothetical protein